MRANIIGESKTDFITEKGDCICGMRYYITNTDLNVSGLSSSTFFVNEEKLLKIYENMEVIPRVGDEWFIDLDTKGNAPKLTGAELLSVGLSRDTVPKLFDKRPEAHLIQHPF